MKRQKVRWVRGIARALALGATALGVAGATGGCDGSADGDAVERMVDVGGHQLYLSCRGTESPTVILESGLGMAGSVGGGWSVVRKEIKDTVRICLYDRAGLGKSDMGPDPRDSQRIVTELHAMLQSAGLQPPYVLVGHSMGGLHIQLFAERYPSEVAAMVFVDPTAKQLVEPASQQTLEEMAAKGASPGQVSEVAGLAPSVAEVMALGPLLDVPVVVLTSSHAAAMQAGGAVAEKWQQLCDAHQALADEVSDGVHVVATTAGHFIQEDEPDLVIDAIRSVCSKVAPAR
jgi:pimeloyl-ACP methyl ester carboxylesterase